MWYFLVCTSLGRSSQSTFFLVTLKQAKLPDVDHPDFNMDTWPQTGEAPVQVAKFDVSVPCLAG